MAGQRPDEHRDQGGGARPCLSRHERRGTVVRSLTPCSGFWFLGTLALGVVGDEETPPAPPLIAAWHPALERRIYFVAEQGVHIIMLHLGPAHGHRGHSCQILQPRKKQKR